MLCCMAQGGASGAPAAVPEVLFLNYLSLSSPESTYARVASVGSVPKVVLKSSDKKRVSRIAAGVDDFAMLEASYVAREALEIRKGAARKPSGLWSWPPDSWKQRFTTAAGR